LVVCGLAPKCRVLVPISPSVFVQLRTALSSTQSSPSRQPSASLNPISKAVQPSNRRVSRSFPYLYSHLHNSSSSAVAEMSDISYTNCPVYSPFFGAMGCMAAIVFTCFGAAYGTAKSGVGICAMGVLRPDLIVKNVVPVVMAGIVGIYGLVVSVLIADGLKQELPLFTAFLQLGAGLSVGLSGLAAGFAIGIVGDAGVRGTAQQPRLFVGMILILIFAEVLGLYGLIVALLMNSRASVDSSC